MVPQLTDAYARQFYYLRLSITDVCNFRCCYCLPNGYQRQTQNNALSLDEIRRIARAFSELGTNKIRLTGGEPTLRRDFIDIISAIHENGQVKTLALTTNGYRMARDIQHWREAGLTSVNVSVDSLDARQFRRITGEDKFQQVMKGIDAAFTAGFDKVKVNTVLMRNINDHSMDIFLDWIKKRSIQLRFIELMETGDNSTLFAQYHLSGSAIRQHILLRGWQQKTSLQNEGPAQIFGHPDYLGEIGLIMPYEKDFCLSCNRLRVSARGHLHLCLFGDQGINLRELLSEDDLIEQLKKRIKESLSHKKKNHFLHQGNSGMTQNLSLIGG